MPRCCRDSREFCHDPKLIQHRDLQIISDLNLLDRQYVQRRACLSEPSAGRTGDLTPASRSLARSIRSTTTADAVASAPAPGPLYRVDPTKFPCTITALPTPLTFASRLVLETSVGCTRISTPRAVFLAIPRCLIRYPSSSAKLNMSAGEMPLMPSV